jgi:hypothetical protein
VGHPPGSLLAYLHQQLQKLYRYPAAVSLRIPVFAINTKLGWSLLSLVHDAETVSGDQQHWPLTGRPECVQYSSAITLASAECIEIICSPAAIQAMDLCEDSIH